LAVVFITMIITLQTIYCYACYLVGQHNIIAIELPHSTRFTLLLLLRIQRYMWRNHVPII